MKRIALLLLAISACKTSDSSPAKAEPPAPTDRAAPSAPRPAPSLPSDPNAQALGSDHPTMPDRPYGRHHDRMAKLDTDGDGVISDQERAAAMKARRDTMRDQWQNGGGAGSN